MSVRIDERGTQGQRHIIYEKFNRWADEGLITLPRATHGSFAREHGAAIAHLISLLGYSDIVEMVENYTSDDADKVMRLAGPHGYAFYKLLVLKQEGKLNERAD